MSNVLMSYAIIGYQSKYEDQMSEHIIVNNVLLLILLLNCSFIAETRDKRLAETRTQSYYWALYLIAN